MHYYNFNIGDYTSHTVGLGLLEDLAYRRLIDKYFLDERPFNGRSTDVARMIGFVEHADAVDYVLRTFFKEKDGLWVHERIEEDLENFKNKIQAASRAGKVSAAKRCGATNSSGRSTDVEQTLYDRSTNQEPITNNHKPITNKKNTRTASAVLRPVEISETVWADFLQIRKTKRLPLTATAWDGILREVEASGLPLEAALRECCARGWGSFKAKWIEKDLGQSKPAWTKRYTDAMLPISEQDIADHEAEMERRRTAGGAA